MANIQTIKLSFLPSRTQDPHHPYVFGARVVIAHPKQKQLKHTLKHWRLLSGFF
jgi:hypothetical protein